MKFSVIKPFISEMLILIFCIVALAWTLIGKDIEIIVHMNAVTFVAIILAVAYSFSLLTRILPTGIRALFDYMFQRTKEDRYVFIDMDSFRASDLTKKFDAELKVSFGMYYLIHLRKGKQIYTCISSSYVDLVKGKLYAIKTGCLSNIFIDAKLEETP